MIHLRPDNALACFESVFERWKPTKSILCSLVTWLWYNSYFIYLYLSISTLSIIFSNESALHIRCPKYWSFSFSINPSNEYSGLILNISFRMYWFDLLAVQGTLKSFLQHHNSKASILQCSPLWSNSRPYMTAGKTIALTRWIFVCKVMSLLF